MRPCLSGGKSLVKILETEGKQQDSSSVEIVVSRGVSAFIKTATAITKWHLRN